MHVSLCNRRGSTSILHSPKNRPFHTHDFINPENTSTPRVSSLKLGRLDWRKGRKPSESHAIARDRDSLCPLLLVLETLSREVSRGRIKKTSPCLSLHTASPSGNAVVIKRSISFQAALKRREFKYKCIGEGGGLGGKGGKSKQKERVRGKGKTPGEIR